MYKGVNILTTFDMWDNMWCFRTVRFVLFSVAVVLAVVLCISFQLLRMFLLQVLYLLFFCFFNCSLKSVLAAQERIFCIIFVRDCCILQHDQTL